MSIRVPISTIRANGWTSNGAATQWECTDEGVLTPDDGVTFTGQKNANRALRMGLEALGELEHAATSAWFLRTRHRHLTGISPGIQNLRYRVVLTGPPLMSYVTVSTLDTYTTAYVPIPEASVTGITDPLTLEVQIITPAGAGVFVSDRWFVSAVELFVAPVALEKWQSTAAPITAASAAAEFAALESARSAVLASQAAAAGHEATQPARSVFQVVQDAQSRIEASESAAAHVVAAQQAAAGAVRAATARSGLDAASDASAGVVASQSLSARLVAWDAPGSL